MLENNLRGLADDQSSSITKESIFYIKHMYVQPLSMEVDWWEIWHQMDVSTMFYICIYCVFTLWGRAEVLSDKITVKMNWTLTTINLNFPLVIWFKNTNSWSINIEKLNLSYNGQFLEPLSKQQQIMENKRLNLIVCLGGSQIQFWWHIIHFIYITLTRNFHWISLYA